jgi:hypothetical protein
VKLSIATSSVIREALRESEEAASSSGSDSGEEITPDEGGDTPDEVHPS